MIVMSSKDEQAQQNELPSYVYSGGEHDHGFPFPSDKKEEYPEPLQPLRFPVPSTSSATPINFPEPSHSSVSYYAPAAAPYSHSAALTASNATTITPLSFSRPRAQGLTYTQFKPIFLLASSDKSTSLSKGFPMTPPPSSEDPHPFVTHDVNEIDWLQFLNDVHAAGSLTEKDVRRSHLPIVSWLPIVGNLSVYGVQKYMKSRKSSTVAKTLDTWNHHFFEPRKIRIVLMRGNERLSGLQENTMGGIMHPPEPMNVSSGIMQNAVGGPVLGDDKKGKGKSKEGVDEAYRLFVLSI